MSRLSSQLRDVLVQTFTCWRHDILKGKADADLLILGNRSQEGTRHTVNLWERFLDRETPDAIVDSEGGEDRFETLSRQTLYHVDKLPGLTRYDKDERESATKQLVLQVEPFVYKLLSLLAPKTFRDLAENNKGLGAALSELESRNFSPYNGPKGEAFKRQSGWRAFSSFDNAIRDVIPARLKTAHQANALTSGERRRLLKDNVEADFDRRHNPLWESVIAVMLGLIDHNSEALREALYKSYNVDRSDPRSGLEIRNGTYRTGELIGEGAYGRVYQGIDLENDRPVAIKFLGDRLSTAESERIEARFEREGQHLSDLQHDNIVTLYRTGRERDYGPFIVMEYVPGLELRDLLDEGRLRPALAIDIGVQLCKALSKAHRHNTIHRDLKPENIRLRAQDFGRLTVKVLDFGLALDLEQSLRLSRTGDQIGTPHYMSPEQFTNGEISRSTDFYALGTILFEMLTGRRPFRVQEDRQGAAEAYASLYHQHLHDDPPGVDAFVDVPERLRDLVSSLLEKKPADRKYESAEDIQSVLTRIRHRDLSAAPLFEAIKPGDAGLKGEEIIKALCHGNLLLPEADRRRRPSQMTQSNGAQGATNKAPEPELKSGDSQQESPLSSAKTANLRLRDSPPDAVIESGQLTYRALEALAPFQEERSSKIWTWGEVSADFESIEALTQKAHSLCDGNLRLVLSGPLCTGKTSLLRSFTGVSEGLVTSSRPSGHTRFDLRHGPDLKYRAEFWSTNEWKRIQSLVAPGSESTDLRQSVVKRARAEHGENSSLLGNHYRLKPEEVPHFFRDDDSAYAAMAKRVVIDTPSLTPPRTTWSEIPATFLDEDSPDGDASRDVIEDADVFLWVIDANRAEATQFPPGRVLERLRAGIPTPVVVLVNKADRRDGPEGPEVLRFVKRRAESVFDTLLLRVIPSIALDSLEGKAASNTRNLMGETLRKAARLSLSRRARALLETLEERIESARSRIDSTDLRPPLDSEVRHLVEEQLSSARTRLDENLEALSDDIWNAFREKASSARTDLDHYLASYTPYECVTGGSTLPTLNAAISARSESVVKSTNGFAATRMLELWGPMTELQTSISDGLRDIDRADLVDAVPPAESAISLPFIGTHMPDDPPSMQFSLPEVETRELHLSSSTLRTRLRAPAIEILDQNATSIEKQLEESLEEVHAEAERTLQRYRRETLDRLRAHTSDLESLRAERKDELESISSKLRSLAGRLEPGPGY